MNTDIAEDNLIQCRASNGIAIPASKPWVPGEPVEFIYAPAGKHLITAGFRRGETITICVENDEQTAIDLQASFDHLTATEPNQEPFGDEEHDAKKATLRFPNGVTKFSWGQIKGNEGVVVAAEPTSYGAEAVNGKVYRSWSPEFATDAEYGKAKCKAGHWSFPEGVRGSQSNPARIVGVSFVMGALTNKPAFRAMPPVKAKKAEAQFEIQASRKSLFEKVESQGYDHKGHEQGVGGEPSYHWLSHPATGHVVKLYKNGKWSHEDPEQLDKTNGQGEESLEKRLSEVHKIKSSSPDDRCEVNAGDEYSNPNNVEASRSSKGKAYASLAKSAEVLTERALKTGSKLHHQDAYEAHSDARRVARDLGDLNKTAYHAGRMSLHREEGGLTASEAIPFSALRDSVQACFKEPVCDICLDNGEWSAVYLKGGEAFRTSFSVDENGEVEAGTDVEDAELKASYQEGEVCFNGGKIMKENIQAGSKTPLYAEYHSDAHRATQEAMKATRFAHNAHENHSVEARDLHEQAVNAHENAAIGHSHSSLEVGGILQNHHEAMSAYHEQMAQHHANYASGKVHGSEPTASLGSIYSKAEAVKAANSKTGKNYESLSKSAETLTERAMQTGTKLHHKDAYGAHRDARFYARELGDLSKTAYHAGRMALHKSEGGLTDKDLIGASEASIDLNSIYARVGGNGQPASVN